MQNNFFVKFLRKWHFFAFLAAYHLRGHLFFCSKCPLFVFTIVVIFENFFCDLALLGHSRCLPIEKINVFWELWPFRDIFAAYYLEWKMQKYKFFWSYAYIFCVLLLFLSSIFHSQIHIASLKIKPKSLTEGGKNRLSGLSFARQY